MDSPHFVHLHLHTDFSLLDGANDIGKLMIEAAKKNMPALAMTDHGNLFGAVQFHGAAGKHGIKPIIGCELYVAKGKRFDRSSSEGEKANHHLTVLATDEIGYRNLVKLTSQAYLEGFYYRPRVDKELLAQHSRGLVALSGCLNGEVESNLYLEKEGAALETAGQWQDIFGKDNFFLEIQDHGLEKQQSVNPRLVSLSKRMAIPLVATNDCHYLNKDDSKAHDILLCIGTGSTVRMERRMRYETDQFYLKSQKEMLQTFSELPEAVYRSGEIADRCTFKMDPVKSPFPHFEVPTDQTLDQYFENVVRQGFEERLTVLQTRAERGLLHHGLAEYRDRLEREMAMIRQMNFQGYFLIVWDFIRYAREHDIPVGPGRGSAAGSLVAYSMRITDIDPLQYGLLFERFLNPERITLPDIDIDFCMRRRDEVIDYVTKRYGRDRVSQIITFGTLGAKAALKDVGRAMEMPYTEVDRIAKLVPNRLHVKLEDVLEEVPQLHEQYQRDSRVRDLFDVAMKLEGLARHASIHAAGIVISPEPLLDLVPLCTSTRTEHASKSEEQQVITQFEMGDLEKLGLLKMDFLALATLTILDDTVKLIEQLTGEKLKLDELDTTDAATYRLFQEGRTNCIFQFESSGMRDILLRYKPERLEDLIALNALYRPGAIQGGMIDDFIKCKHGAKQISYELPEMQPVLEETYGVMVYQEQVMQIAMVLAGYTLGEADILRRAMGKKKAEVMAAQKQKFVNGCKARKINERKAEKIFNMMLHFSGYGFNKSHSAAYALLAYQTAYLKVHYPVFFMSAVLTNEIGNTDKIVKYINECRSLDLPILPPDINESALHFTPVVEAGGRPKIRFGLAAIKNVGENAIKAIVEARRSGGPFHSLFDFCERVDLRSLNKRMIESLIKAGCFDSLKARRSQLSAVIDRAMEAGSKVQRDSQSGQSGLFFSSGHAAVREKLPDLEEWQPQVLLNYEKETLGFFITGHPLTKYADDMAQYATDTSESLNNLEGFRDVCVGGVFTGVRHLRTKKGDRMATAVLEDLQGTIDLVLFPQTYQQYEDWLKVEDPVFVKGRAESDDSGKLKIKVSEILAMKDIRMTQARRLIVHVSVAGFTEELAPRLLELFERHSGDCSIVFELEHEQGFLITLKPDPFVRIKPQPQLIQEIEAMCGRGTVRLVG
ncbi:MAG: DNA polymerase III subunit alpha [Acidobacteriia bacterium]|nr:DNA polymerase III subunit alpha [Terriglobia bacterium]